MKRYPIIDDYDTQEEWESACQAYEDNEYWQIEEAVERYYESR